MRAIPAVFEALKDDKGLWSMVAADLDFLTTSGNFSVTLVYRDGALSDPFLNLCTCSERKFILAGDPTYLHILPKIIQLRRKETVPHLIRALEAGEKNVRLAAAALLGQLGQDAEPAVPALTRASQDDDEDLSHVASDALRSVQGIGDP